MSLIGPIVLVAETSASDLVEALGAAGASPILDVTWAEAAEAIAALQPAAVVVVEADPPADPAIVPALDEQIGRASPWLPVLACVPDDGVPLLANAQPIPLDITMERLLERLRATLRVRALHAAVLRRADSLRSKGEQVPVFPEHDPLDDATVLILGRGRCYPSLTVSVGERVALIGALGIETAARYLNARDIDGVVIGDGFPPRTVAAFLTVLAEDARFRDMPVGVMGRGRCPGDYPLPNLVAIDADPAGLVEHILPLVRMHALESRCRRILASLDAGGVLDPETGLLARDIFWRDLILAVDNAEARGSSLSVARLTFDQPLARRASLDAARLVSRLVRAVDFACLETDGSIVAAFTETDLRAAHVITRRIASVLKRTMLAADEGARLDPTITLATLKPVDTVETLVTRLLGGHAVAAE